MWGASSRARRRTELAHHCAIMNCEQIKKGDVLELGAVNALLGEIEERAGIPQNAPGQGEPAAQQPEEQKRWADRVEKAEHFRS
eukprot:7282266-Pyramimonas_sp.AAC.1